MHLVSQRRILVEALGAAAAGLAFLLAYYHLPISDADEGIIVTGAERILRGEIPYRDFFSELGPASFYLQALIFELSAVSLTAVRFPAWLLGGAISGLLYFLARRIMPATGAGLATSIFVLICYPVAYNLSHHWWGNLFLILTILCLAPRTQPVPLAEPHRNRIRLLMAGALAAATLLAMQPKGVWAILASVVYLLLESRMGSQGGKEARSRHGLKQACWFLIGATAVLGCISGYFALQGALGAWIEDNFIFLFTGYQPYHEVPQASAFQSLWGAARLTSSNWAVHLNLHLVAFFFFFVMAPVIALGGTAWQLYSARRQPKAEASILMLLLLESAGAFLSECHAPEVYHAVWGAPPMLGLLVYQWGRGAEMPNWLGRVAKASALLAVALLATAGARKAIRTLRVDAPVETRRGVVYVLRRSEAQDMQNIINTIQERVPAGSETFFYPYLAELYFLTGTRNPTRFDVLLPDFHSPAHIEEAITQIRGARPGFIFSFAKIQRWTFRPHYPEDPPDVIGPHPVGKWIEAPGSGYRLDATVVSGYTTGFHIPGRNAVMEVWKADR